MHRAPIAQLVELRLRRGPSSPLGEKGANLSRAVRPKLFGEILLLSLSHRSLPPTAFNFRSGPATYLSLKCSAGRPRLLSASPCRMLARTPPPPYLPLTSSGCPPVPSAPPPKGSPPPSPYSPAPPPPLPSPPPPPPITTCVAEGVQFSLSVSRNKPITAAIAAIDEATYTPVHYPGAVQDPDTGQLISDAQVAETSYTLRLGRGRTLAVRLVVRRVKDARHPDALFPVWRYHPFMTNSALPVAEADFTHRRHAIIETTFADLIDGPLADIPSGLFAANRAGWPAR